MLFGECYEIVIRQTMQQRHNSLRVSGKYNLKNSIKGK